jgi:hypothetical protein
VLCSILLLLSFSKVVLGASGSSSISAPAVPVAGNWLLGNTQNSTMAVLPPFEPTCFPKHQERVKVRARGEESVQQTVAHYKLKLGHICAASHAQNGSNIQCA